ncbi:hypothetical protein PBRA_008524 [Plasmodiophora brassicae]|uniref:acetyl-CoA C-acetyltransferase n=1 Tax=Plasmodiophora brassicae TaxID=37360 RepID=A0A0G4J219_PLABS|nr:hypothetical protein PBRA_008524 [Plasmodiophora brassicae]
MGCVLTAGVGQAPATQASREGGLPWSVPTTAINKVCSSGLKAVICASQVGVCRPPKRVVLTSPPRRHQTITTKTQDVVIAGGMESMSRAPFLMPAASRTGLRYGSQTVPDTLVHDGLTDPWDLHPMGVCAEHCSKEYAITREAQDAYAVQSYQRALHALDNGLFKKEIVPIEVLEKKKLVVVDEDAEPRRVDFSKICPESPPSSLRPVFTAGGTVTAANASSLNDGAASVLVTSAEFAKSRNLKPMARILSYADAAQTSLLFTTAPSLAIPIALERAGLKRSDVDLWEINEAFSVVALVNMQLLELDPAKVNVNGGGVSLGYVACAGGTPSDRQVRPWPNRARIVVTLLHALEQRGASIGVAAICNGGGGASAIVVERVV